MKKVILILGLLLISSTSFAGTPESDADMTIKRYCPGASAVTNRSLCLEAHNIKLQLEILDKIKKIEEEIKALKTDKK